MDGFCQVESAAAGGLADLLAATEAVRDEKCVRRGLAHGGQQHAFPGGLRDRVFLTFEAKRPAIPQHPESADCNSAPIFRSSDSACVIFMSAF
jgi:hypothetical protein